jgi:hypothetical protein
VIAASWCCYCTSSVMVHSPLHKIFC